MLKLQCLTLRSIFHFPTMTLNEAVELSSAQEDDCLYSKAGAEGETVGEEIHRFQWKTASVPLI